MTECVPPPEWMDALITLGDKGADGRSGVITIDGLTFEIAAWQRFGDSQVRLRMRTDDREWRAYLTRLYSSVRA